MSESEPKRLHAGLVPCRPYWNGFDRKTDELRARDLLRGRIVRQPSGRSKVEFLQKDDPREGIAREALARLLTYYTAHDVDASVDIVGPLCSALTNDSRNERRIVFQFRKKGKRSDVVADYQLGLHVLIRTIDHGWPVEAAVQEAMNKYGLKRKAVFEAYKRTKKQFRAWGVSVV
jgi:hypothetical protein